MAAVANPGREAQLAAVREKLERILASQIFRNAEAQKKFLRLVVEEALDGRAHQIKEFAIGSDVFARGSSFDPRIDTIVRVPGITNFDLALLKDTRVPKISESLSVQFRAEFFNIFNHANFGPPAVGDSVQGTNGGANISTSAGRITTTTTNSRQIQFGLKILF